MSNTSFQGEKHFRGAKSPGYGPVEIIEMCVCCAFNKSF